MATVTKKQLNDYLEQLDAYREEVQAQADSLDNDEDGSNPPQPPPPPPGHG